MKDAYSFDVEEAGAEKTYKDMYDAYVNIFKRCGFGLVLSRPIRADRRTS